VEIAFDPAKNERNLRERSLGFQEAADFDFATANYESEFRNGEHRIVAVGYLKNRLHVLCFITLVQDRNCALIGEARGGLRRSDRLGLLRT